MVLQAHDLDDKSRPLFKSALYDDVEQFGSRVTRVMEVAGRKWVLDIRVKNKVAWTLQTAAPYVSFAVFFLLAAMLAWITHSQLRAVRTAKTLQKLSEKNLIEKDLLLQEMKHRIKNSIARILAMARQTAHHSETIRRLFREPDGALAGDGQRTGRAHAFSLAAGRFVRSVIKRVGAGAW